MSVTTVIQFGVVVGYKPPVPSSKIKQFGVMVGYKPTGPSAVTSVSQFGVIVGYKNIVQARVRQFGLVIGTFGIPAPGHVTATYVAGQGIRLNWDVPRALRQYVYRGYNIYRRHAYDLTFHGIHSRKYSQPYVFQDLDSTSFMDYEVGTEADGTGVQYIYYMTTALPNNVLYVAEEAPSTGTFKLAVTTANGDTQTTDDLAYNVVDTDLQTALEGLSNIGSGNVRVKGDRTTASSPWIISPIGTLTGQPLQIAPNYGNMPAGSPVLYVTNFIESGASNFASAVWEG